MTGTAPESSAPLEGVRILELGSLIAGPFTTRLLGDFGAEVIKIEAPGSGDPMRQWGAAKLDGHSLWWPVQSRSKKVVTLNLRVPRGQELFRRIVAGADVLVENFRPGTMERWGLGPMDLEQINPGLIYARISGFGQTGPYAGRGGFAAVGEAMSGMRHLNGFPGEAPPRTGLSLGDSLSGLFAAMGILIALVERERHQQGGQIVDCSILESCFAMLESVVPEYEKLRVVREPSGTTIANNAPSNLYRSADGRWMVIAANSDALFARLATALGREDLVADERFSDHDARGRNMDLLDEIIQRWAADRAAAEIETTLNTAGVVCGPVNTVAEVVRDPHVRARGMLATIDSPDIGRVVGPAAFPRLSRTPGRAHFEAPGGPGADNDTVYRRLLGMSAAELGELRREGVV